MSIEVQAPVNKKQATTHVTTQIWVLPGKHILGDGIILEIPGFIIDILEPRSHQFISIQSLEEKGLRIEANIVMMCGCTISRNGLWDSEKMEIAALVSRNGETLKELPLELISENLFEGYFPTVEPGLYEIIIYAYDENTGNTGVDKVNYVVDE